MIANRKKSCPYRQSLLFLGLSVLRSCYYSRPHTGCWAVLVGCEPWNITGTPVDGQHLYQGNHMLRDEGRNALICLMALGE